MFWGKFGDRYMNNRECAYNTIRYWVVPVEVAALLVVDEEVCDVVVVVVVAVVAALVDAGLEEDMVDVAEDVVAVPGTHWSRMDCYQS